jgi:hypothetical protein
MDYAVFLNIASILQGNSAPISTEHGAWSYVAIFTNVDVSNDHGCFVNKGFGVYHGDKALKCVKWHGFRSKRFAERPANLREQYWIRTSDPYPVKVVL